MGRGGAPTLRRSRSRAGSGLRLTRTPGPLVAGTAAFRTHLNKKAKEWKAISRRHSLSGPQQEAEQQQTKASAALMFKSGGAFGATNVLAGGAEKKQNMLGRAVTADRWEKLVIGVIFIRKREIPTATHFVPSLSLAVEKYR